MNKREAPNGTSSQNVRFSRWILLIYWPLGFLLVHNLLPWSLSFLSTRSGWVGDQPGIGNLFGIFFILAGIAGIIWTMTMHYVRTPGKAEWAQTPDYLLVEGPYRFSRNPMFLAELILWLGWAMYLGSIPVLTGFAILGTLMNFVAVPREEKELAKKFGEEYREYRDHVSRWFGRTGK